MYNYAGTTEPFIYIILQPIATDLCAPLFIQERVEVLVQLSICVPSRHGMVAKQESCQQPICTLFWRDSRIRKHPKPEIPHIGLREFFKQIRRIGVMHIIIPGSMGK